MLTVEHLRVREREGQLSLPALQGRTLQRAQQFAEAYLGIARRCTGRSRAELEGEVATVEVGLRERPLAAGLWKLVLDRCRFEEDQGIDYIALRRRVFEEASRRRKECLAGGIFDRLNVLEALAPEFGLDVQGLEEKLFGDLPESQTLLEADLRSPAQLLRDYEIARVQALLLRASALEIEWLPRRSEETRALFRKLKFLQLLYRVDPLPAGYRLTIDGPLSLWGPTQKYGLRLALFFPTLLQCVDWRLRAQIRFRKGKRASTFEIDASSLPRAAQALDEETLRPELTSLLERFGDHPRWRVERAEEIMPLPGLGVCVPDLRFEDRESGALVYAELLGYWSRQGAWQRVEMARRGLPHPMLFLLPKSLRISEENLDEDAAAELYVFRQQANAHRVAERLSRLVEKAKEKPRKIKKLAR